MAARATTAPLAVGQVVKSVGGVESSTTVTALDMPLFPDESACVAWIVQVPSGSVTTLVNTLVDADATAVSVWTALPLAADPANTLMLTLGRSPGAFEAIPLTVTGPESGRIVPVLAATVPGSGAVITGTGIEPLSAVETNGTLLDGCLALSSPHWQPKVPSPTSKGSQVE